MNETSETPGLKSLLDSLVQTMLITAGHTAPVVLMPHEARALVAEVERLRGERNAVVAWLRAEAEAAEWALTAAGYEHAADAIERGDHRCEEEE